MKLRERLERLPKAELHVHLDGSLRTRTMIELADHVGVDLPSRDPEELAARMRVADSSDLEEYLQAFRTTLALMQRAEALERVAYELAVDNAAENVRYLEVRYSPVLLTERGLTLDEAVRAPLRGLRRAEEETGIRTAIIVCALRTMDPATSRRLADLTVDFRGRGVVAFDLAGAERDYPPKKHRAAFYRVVNENMALTIHAGEAYGPESIHQAIHTCHADRIGHGTKLLEDPELMAYVRDFRIPLEVCLTSNVQTGAVPSFAEHPVRRYFDDGIVVTLNTDNRLMSGTTLTEEYALAHEHLGFTWEELVRIARMGFEAGFLPWHEKQALLADFDREVARL